VSDELKWLNALKNMLLVQERLKALRADCLFVPPPGFSLDADGPLAHPVLRSLAVLLDPSCLAQDRVPPQQSPQPQGGRAQGADHAWRHALSRRTVRLKARLARSKDSDPNIYPLW
jgi:hypothetical protein